MISIKKSRCADVNTFLHRNRLIRVRQQVCRDRAVQVPVEADRHFAGVADVIRIALYRFPAPSGHGTQFYRIVVVPVRLTNKIKDG